MYDSYNKRRINGYSNEEIAKLQEEREKYLLAREEMFERRKKIKKNIEISILIIGLLVILFFIYKNYFRPVKIDPRIDRNSIHYVTDLYYSDGRYYEKYLNAQEKKMYLYVLNDIKDLRERSSASCKQFGYNNNYECAKDIEKIVDVVLMEHPDLFWYRSSGAAYYTSQDKVLFYHQYVSKNKFRLYFVERKLLRKIDELASKYKNDSDYDKIVNVYTWLGGNKHYSKFITTKDGTAWSALLTNNTVCAGFAAASQLLFQRLGIDSTLVVGKLNGGGHAWNLVYLEDGYYWYDSTVGGSVGKDSLAFYYGLFFKDTLYRVDIIDANKINFGSKYLKKYR